MGFKIAEFQYVDKFGTTQNALMTWRGADIDLYQNGSVRFAVYENLDEKNRTDIIGGNVKRIFVMPITPEDVISIFSQEGNVALIISDISWNKALTTPFIFSRVQNEDNSFSIVQKSLNDLNANVIDVGLSL